jgi:hypothetical protein
MALEPRSLDPDPLPAGPPAERRPYTPRSDDGTRVARSAVAMLPAICGGLAAVFLFFAAMGAVDLGDAIAATLVAIALAAVWFAGFYHRHRTKAGRTQWRDRERRGF